MKRIFSLTLAAALLLALLSACGSSSGGGQEKQVDLAAFYLTLTEKYQVPQTPEQAYPDELADDDEMWEYGPDTREERLQNLEERRRDLRDVGLAFYPGLSDIAAEQCLTYVSEISFSASEAVLVQVSNAADVDAVKSILQARIDAQAADTWYPLAAEAWQNYSRIVSNGSYIMLIVGEDCDAVVDEFNALFK